MYVQPQVFHREGPMTALDTADRKDRERRARVRRARERSVATLNGESVEQRARKCEARADDWACRLRQKIIPQPDGSIACMPEWMTHEQAVQIKLSVEPYFPLEILRSMRAEVDALLASLPS